MAEYIGCRKCDSTDCKGCNLKNLETMLNNGKFDCLMNGNRCINTAADVAPVRHGRWELTTHSFYRDTFDESCELCVYIVANCSECSGNHPNSYQVFSKTLYAPDDADDNFRFDKKAEEEKALLEFRNKKYEFAYYCPNCGAKMDGCDGNSDMA